MYTHLLKNSQKTKLISLVLCFIISSFLFSCQKDEVVENNNELIESDVTKFKRLSIKELLQNDNTFSNLSNTYIPVALSSKNRTNKTSSKGLIITSDTINVIEKENYKSYTLRIKRKGFQYDTENLIVEENKGIRKAYILSYNFDNDWITDYVSGIHTPPKGTVYYSDFELSNLNSKTTASKFSGSCHYLTITITAPCPCKGHFRSCRCYQQASTFRHRELICGQSSSGGGSETRSGSPLDTENGSGGFGGGGAPVPNDRNNNSNSSANLKDMAEFVEFKVNRLIKNLKLDSNQAKWVGNNVKESLDIYDYVAKENNWSREAKDFAKLAVEAKRDDGEVDFDDKIIDELKGKEKCLHDLLSKKGNDYVKNIFKNFKGESEFGIKIVSKDKVYSEKLKKYVNGNAFYNSSSPIIEISISTSNASDRPALAVARTILHEYIHADIYRKLKTKSPSPEELDFRKTFDQYEKDHHETMASLYINSMKEALKKFHKDALVGDYNYLTEDGTKPLPDNFYEALAWQGLDGEGVDAYDNLSELKKKELEKSLEKYYHATTKNCPK